MANPLDEYFRPITLGKLELPNRLVMAPMTRSRAYGGLTGDLTARYYAQRASAGLIITEATQVSEIGQGYIQTPGLHGDEQIQGWRKVTDAVHAAGGRIVAQLVHCGRIGHPVLYADGATPVGPSAIASGESLYTPEGLLEHPVPREMTTEDIARTVADFTAAARNAVEAGFDGVELHGANGFLLHQFLADGSNRRTDGYGGSIAGRIRFTLEVVEAVSTAIGPERVGLRLSPGLAYNGITESDTADLYRALVRALAPTPLAYLHLFEAVSRDMTELIRQEWPGGLILCPHPTPDSFPATPETGAAALRDGVADAIALATMWVANPDLPARIRAGGPYNEADPATFYGGDHRGYTDYPTLEDRA
ncbi:alkene reductase [Bailinhaonella thermotolerans]|uniref:Alkene reductase n=1 Tax=Bailinhaonella thermotolerans TaxID=1070861 RepID=A0A3A4A514_9ACTN|nr:alkene reductase [Bailinhaonella thermotolerans]RJL22931.1 alkene reductase [Bailinhaonella thermotolerans]